MQATAFPCSCLMVSGQIVPSERNLACISGCGNCHFARCSCDDGMASPQKYLITCSREENDERHFHERETGIAADFIHVIAMVLSMLVNSLYNIIDSFFVAQISEEAMTALSLVYPVQNFINAVGIGLALESTQ